MRPALPTLACASILSASAAGLPPVYVVPNFHPASCGWLANWSAERNYCANSYLAHLDRVRDDPSYRFALSECNNLIAIQNFAPERFEELKQRVREGRVELVNGFFLEPTVSLSGGEALAKMGIEGLRWQRQVMRKTPRFCWAIDICGAHEQLPQLNAQLGLEALVYARNNPSPQSVFLSQSPDGSRIPTLVTDQYSDWSKDGISQLFGERNPLTNDQLGGLRKYFSNKAANTPPGAPVLVLGGKGDYSLPPVRKKQPAELLAQWQSFAPDVPLRIATFSDYFDQLKLDELKLPVIASGTDYTWNAFWVQSPRVKSWYRRDEHALQAAEIAATIASLKSDAEYPAQTLYQGWLQMLLNMDRNTLWGAAGGMVYVHETSWDARDRFEWVEKHSARITRESVGKAAGAGEQTVLFNPLNWDRHDPLDDGSQPQLPATGFGAPAKAAASMEIKLPDQIETRFYSARLDPSNGSLVSLKLKPSGREMLGGAANVIVAEKGVRKGGQAGDELSVRPGRPRLGSSSDAPCKLRVTENNVAITVDATGPLFGGGECKRTLRFHKDHPRIDFVTELNDLPDQTVVVAEFPLAESPAEIRRGIPFGFSHGAWSTPNPELHGKTRGIFPAIRWSDYTLPDGGGVALLDRGLTGREINDRTPVIYLLSTVEKYYGYPNSWLSGKGRHRLEYALVARESGWNESRVPQMAWEYNCPPIAVQRCKPGTDSFLKTSGNVIVEAMRRDGPDIEIRLTECLGVAGQAEITTNLPHQSAALTDLLGNRAQNLDGGPTYRFPVNPQQIVTLRLRTAKPVPEIQALTDWAPLVPENKRAALREYQPDKKGHPPRGE